MLENEHITQAKFFIPERRQKRAKRDGQKTHLCNSVKYAFISHFKGYFARSKYIRVYLYTREQKRAEMNLF